MNSGGTTLKNYKCGIQFFCENVRKYFELQDNSDRKEIETGWKSDNCMVNSGSTWLNNYFQAIPLAMVLFDYTRGFRENVP